MPTPNRHALEVRFDEAWPVRSWSDAHVVLGVSGGADSAAMLRAAVALKQRCDGRGRLHVAHLNHALRGAEGDADQAWLAALCRRLDVPLEAARADVAAIAGQQGDGLEAAARHARYDFFTQMAERIGARFVAVAHTADDQVETVLHRLLRGTGLSGLVGMRPIRPLSSSVALVRPLLNVRRREVIEYLAAIEQDYRTDATNVDLRWTRNRLRHELLPAVREKFNTDVDAALLRLAAQAREAQQLVAQRAAECASHCVAIHAEGQTAAGGTRTVTAMRIDCPPLAGEPPLVIREVFKIAWSDADWPLQAMGFHEWQQLAELVRSEGRSQGLNLPGNIKAARDENAIVLQRLGQP